MAASDEFEEPGDETVTLRKPTIVGTIDYFVAAIPWTRNRMVLVFLREHAGRWWVRLRTFNRHRTKGCWYPGPRYFVIPVEMALALAAAIRGARLAKRATAPPDWFADFEKQYANLPRKRSTKRWKGQSGRNAGAPADADPCEVSPSVA